MLRLPFPLTCLVGSALAIAACSSSSSRPTPGPAIDPPPPAVCKSPGALPAAAWFTDVTKDVGLVGVAGVRAAAGDLDGDGWVDLVLHDVGAARDTPPTKYMKRVLMNRHGVFQDATADSGLLDSRDGPATGRLSHLTVLADVDNDGDLDLFDGTYLDASTKPPASNDRSEIWLNDGKGHFTFAPQSAPSAKSLPTSGGTFADFDRDGNVDLFVGTWYVTDEGAGNFLYKGNGDGTFVDVSDASKVLRAPSSGDQAKYLSGQFRRPAYGVSSCDVDGDGHVDFLASAYGRAYNELWRNAGDGTFTDIGFGTPVAADDDLEYHDNEFYRCWCKDNAGQCTAADSQPKIDCTQSSWTPGFDDQAARLGGNTFSTACGDLDNDGDMDLVHADIRHWHIGESSDSSQILQNGLAQGKFGFARVPNDKSGMTRTHTNDTWNEGDMDVAMFDFDGDGRKDIYLGSSDYPDTWGTLFQQRSDGTFADATAPSGFHHYHAHGFVAVDYDADGDLDLVVTTSTARCAGDAKCPPTEEVRLYRNDVGNLSNFVQLRLHGAPGKSNAAGIGARVAVTAGGVTQVQEVNGGYGHFGMQHGLVLTFGLGAACAVDKVEVAWPDAARTVDTFPELVPNYLVDLTQGDPKPKYPTASK